MNIEQIKETRLGKNVIEAFPKTHEEILEELLAAGSVMGFGGGHTEVDTDAAYLSSAMVWHDSPQGHEFWARISEF
jgi:hypothetical protein